MSGILEPLASMLQSGRTLQALLPGALFPFATAHVVLITTQPRGCDALIRAIETAASRPLAALRIDLHRPDSPLPDLRRATYPIHAIWFVYRHDRSEYQGTAFVEWADAQRAVLAATPLHGFALYDDDELGRTNNPIEMHTARVVTRDVLVAPILLDTSGGAFAGGTPRVQLQLQIAERLLLTASRHGHSNRPAAARAAEWDAIASAELASLYSQRSNGAHPLTTALRRMRHLQEVRGAASSAGAAVEAARRAASALEVSSDGDTVVPLVRELALQLNDLRRVGRLHPDDDYVPPSSFANDFQSLQRRALDCAADLIRDLRANGKTEDAEPFENAREELQKTVQIILLGAFSSGKSTLINALLGLTAGKTQLPMSGQPETATINVLEHDERNHISVKFAATRDLHFFQPSRTDKKWMKINREEIGAFLSWWENGLIDRTRPPHCDRFDSPRPRGGSRKRADDEATACTPDDLAYLRWAKTQKEWNFLPVEDLQQQRAIATAKNIRFRAHPTLPDPDDAEKAFEWLKQPQNALRVAEATIHRTTEALNGLRFVDTPGTDSQVSHHHTMARSYIELNPASPVVYLFDATTAGSEADEENVAFLERLKQDNARLFFVINKRGTETRLSDREVVDKVAQCLRDARLQAKRIYFVDAQTALTDRKDDQWRSLETDLRSFVNHNQTEWLRGVIGARFRDALASAITIERKRLESLRSERAADSGAAEEWLGRAHAVARVLKQFEDEAAEERGQILRGTADDLRVASTDLQRELAAFEPGAFIWREAKMREKVAELVDLVATLNPWPQRLKSNLENASKRLQAFLRHHLRDQIEPLDLRIAQVPVPPDFVSLTLTELRDKASQDVGRSEWVLRFSPALREKASTLRTMVKSETAAAVGRVHQAFDSMVQQYREQIVPAERRARGFANDAKSNAGNDAKIKAAEASLARLGKHHRELNAILQ